jgi:flagellar basal-body rod protein FlgB
MLDKMTERLDFQSKALVLRAERQRVIASNIANADTPGYVARDYQFGAALRAATGGQTTLAKPNAPIQPNASAPTHKQHMALSPLAGSTASLGTNSAELGYSIASQPSLDNNTVDLDRERANFVDNSVRYEATLRFLNGSAKTMLSAIQGQ